MECHVFNEIDKRSAFVCDCYSGINIFTITALYVKADLAIWGSINDIPEDELKYLVV